MHLTPKRSGAIALVLAALALLVRVLPVWHRVFSDTGVLFFGHDAWYHLRRIEFLVANFPTPLSFDPFAGPDGVVATTPPLFEYLVAVVSLLVGLGSPSTSTIEIVAAVLPPLCGAACVLVVFALARLVHCEVVGLLATATLAVHPGEFLLLTTLGSADHHALEALLAVSVIYLAISTLGRGGWPRGLGTGVCLGAYLMAFGGGALWVLLIAIGVAAEAAAAWLGGRSARFVAQAAALWAVGGIVVVLPLYRIAYRPSIQLAALAGLALLAATVAGADRWRARGAWLSLTTTAVSAALGLWLVTKTPYGSGAIDEARRLIPNPASMSINEASSLLVDFSGQTLLSVLSRFGPSFFVALVGIGLHLARARRHPPGAGLLTIWGLLSFLLALLQIRFAVYWAPALALFAAFVFYPVLRLECSWRGWLAVPDPPRADPVTHPAGVGLVAALVLLHSLWAVPTQLDSLGMIGPGWREATDYLRNSTAPPFAEADAYLRANSEEHRAAYTVMSWWDPGYWIMRRGRRVPVASPNQHRASEAAVFLLAPTPEQAMAVALRNRSRFAALSPDLLLVGGVPTQLTAVGKYAPHLDRPWVEWFHWVDANGERRSFGGLSPDYYRTTVARLLLFGGRAAVPERSTTLVTFRSARDENGDPYRHYLGHETYDTYEAAIEAARRSVEETKIVGVDPFRSCVPIERWPGVEVVFRSRAAVRLGWAVVPEVILFRLHGAGES